MLTPAQGLQKPVTFAADPQLPRFARTWVSHRLLMAGFPRAGYRTLHENAELVISELVTNAIAATPDGSVRLDLKPAPASDRLRLEVWDGCDRLPSAVLADLDGESGRGLLIVAAVAAAHGVEVDDAQGKTVWAELDVAP